MLVTYNFKTMCFDLYNPSIALLRTISRQFWVKALELARMYGWQPLGTRMTATPDHSLVDVAWHGTYLTNDGQMVRAEDALSLAAALERSLDDIPDAEVEMDWDLSVWVEDDLPEWLSPEERELVEEELQEGLLDIMGTHPFEFFAGEEKRQLVQLIRFCRLGSFEIL